MSLTKIASPRLVEEVQGFYSRLVNRVRTWYVAESKNLTVEVSKKKMDAFFGSLAIELGVDAVEGATPFSPTAIEWVRYRAE
jgi:hypothetical protein